MALRSLSLLFLLLLAVSMTPAPDAAASDTVASARVKSVAKKWGKDPVTGRVSHLGHLASFKTSIQMADGSKEELLIKASLIQERKWDMNNAWSDYTYKTVSQRLYVETFLNGKELQCSILPNTATAELELLLPSGEILNLGVDGTRARSEFHFTVGLSGRFTPVPIPEEAR